MVCLLPGDITLEIIVRKDNLGIENNQALSEIIKKPGFIDNLYDAIRLVNPVSKEVRSYLKTESSMAQSASPNCFGIWDRNTVCENCISMRSFNQKRTAVKLEYGNGKIYMVIATPFNSDVNNPSIVELFKDITDDGVVDIEGLGPTELSKLVSRKNESIMKDAITQIYNEKHIFERLPYDLVTAAGKRTNLAVFLIRIANLEALANAGGDGLRERVIKEIARVMNHILYKSSDWASRYREADFVLVVHEMNKNKAKRTCQRIHKKISSLKLGSLLNNLEIEIKIGYHIVTGEKSTPEQIIESAEKMLSSLKAADIENKSARQYNKFFNKHPLTLREREVALLLAAGNSNNEIAKKIFIGLSTVKKHVSAIFLKTNTKSRAEFIARLTVPGPD